jgi:hypothetical protein
MGVSGVSLREITDQKREAVLALRIAESQEGCVSSVADSLEEARDTPEGNPWYRAIYADDQPVGFVMLSWNVDPGPAANHRAVVPLEAADRRAMSGYGREAVRLVAGIARDQGASELLTSYVSGERSPESFYRQIGFVPTSEQDEKGEKVLALRLRN